MFYDFVMSRDEKRELDTAGKVMQKKLRRLAKEHTRGLRDMLGKLRERYDVELSAPESYSSRRMPVGISLTDRNVGVPLSDWGSGTQNRTHILMAILQASRIRTADSPDEKITPLVVIEEPESFLHPSAQAEFGRLLRELSKDLRVQIIVTTHSPYMLNQEDPGSNILVCREPRRGKLFGTTVVDTKGPEWMVPFSDHLGLAPEEFSNWQPIFSSVKSRVLLVEGPTDQEYFLFLFLKQGIQGCDRLCPDIQVEAYGGKDTLKNTVLVQFVLRSFDKVFVTYDIDAEGECRSALTRAGLKEGRDHMGLGLRQAGKDCIEGLLPERLLCAVNGAETDLVMKLGSKDNSERRKAKEALKRKYLAEFKSHADYSKEETKELQRAVRTVNSKLANIR
jgi:predicted ATP-dependent endonuclease of OLD family